MAPTITGRHPPLPLDELINAIKMSAEKQALIRPLVQHHPTLSYKWGGPWRYRRARKLRSGEVPGTVNDLIWRKGIPASLGRANPAGFQVLYLADRRDTAFREARATNDDVVLTEFEILPGQGIHVVPLGELAQIQRTGEVSLRETLRRRCPI
jgi:RES domain